MKEQPTRSDNLGDLRRQARLNELRLKIAQQNEALAALRRAGCRDSLEGFYDSPANLFDPRDYLIEVPRGFGGAIPSTRNDRDQGRDFPIFRTEQELAVIRGAARLLTSTSPIAVGILTTLTNYVIGPGFHYAVAPRADLSLVGAGQLAVIAGRVIDEFLDENDWLGDLDRELFQRSRVDGEYFLGLWHVGNGHMQARAVEPDQVTEPSNKLGLDEWLGCVSEAGCAATSPASGWTFGVHTDDVDSQGIHGFYVQWTDRDTEWDYFPGGNEPILSPDGAALWMEHAKLNVVRGVKRGLSDFFAVQGNLDLARRVLRNMGEGSAVQAAIAWIQETAPGTTQAQTSSATLARADARYTTQTSQGSRTHTAQQYDPATILKVPSGQKYLPGPLGAQNAPSFITAAEALLRTVAVRWSLPENLVTGTAENNNFASSLVAESPFVKFAESQQQFYARRDRRTLKRVLWFAWSAGRFGDVPWSLLDRTLEITVTPPQIEVRDPEKETQVRAALHAAGILSKKTWSAQEGLDFAQEQKNLAAEAQSNKATGAKSGAAATNSSHAQADSASAESLEADWDPSKHPRGGNPENRGEFSKVAGLIDGAMKPERAADFGERAFSSADKNAATEQRLWTTISDRVDHDFAGLSEKQKHAFDEEVEIAAMQMEQANRLNEQEGYSYQQQQQLRGFARRLLLHKIKVRAFELSRGMSAPAFAPLPDSIHRGVPAEPDFLRRAMDKETARRAADDADRESRPTIRGISKEQAQIDEDRYTIQTYEKGGRATADQTKEYYQALDRQHLREREATMASYGDGYWNYFLGNLAYMLNPANDGGGTFNDVLAPLSGFAAPSGAGAVAPGALAARRRPPNGRKSVVGRGTGQPSGGNRKRQPIEPRRTDAAAATEAPLRPDPNWRSTQTGTTSGNSKILRKNLGLADGSGLDAHHIVASTEERAKPARDLLDKYQIDVNDRANGIPLPPKGNKPAHHGHKLHSRNGIDKVNERLKSAAESGRSWGESRQRLLDELGKIHSEIERGEFP